MQIASSTKIFSDTKLLFEEEMTLTYITLLYKYLDNFFVVVNFQCRSFGNRETKNQVHNYNKEGYEKFKHFRKIFKKKKNKKKRKQIFAKFQ